MPLYGLCAGGAGQRRTERNPFTGHQKERAYPVFGHP